MTSCERLPYIRRVHRYRLSRVDVHSRSVVHVGAVCIILLLKLDLGRRGTHAGIACISSERFDSVLDPGHHFLETVNLTSLVLNLIDHELFKVALCLFLAGSVEDFLDIERYRAEMVPFRGRSVEPCDLFLTYISGAIDVEVDVRVAWLLNCIVHRREGIVRRRELQQREKLEVRCDERAQEELQSRPPVCRSILAVVVLVQSFDSCFFDAGDYCRDRPPLTKEVVSFGAFCDDAEIRRIHLQTQIDC